MRTDRRGQEHDEAAPRLQRESGAGSSSPSSARSTAVAPSALPPEVAAEIRRAAELAGVTRRERLVERAESAQRSYQRGRFVDALRSIKPVADEVPGVAAVRELAGLAAYRSGRWRDALRHLEALRALEDSNEHIPVLMDCQRALGRPRKVTQLWTELRQSSPDPDVLAEGRIVAASTMAEGGDLDGAIAELAAGSASRPVRNPSSRHLRQWYVLADLYERAGDLPRARQFFERVYKADPAAYDVGARLGALGSPARPRRRTGSTGRRATGRSATGRSATGRSAVGREGPSATPK